MPKQATAVTADGDQQDNAASSAASSAAPDAATALAELAVAKAELAAARAELVAAKAVSAEAAETKARESEARRERDAREAKARESEAREAEAAAAKATEEKADQARAAGAADTDIADVQAAPAGIEATDDTGTGAAPVPALDATSTRRWARRPRISFRRPQFRRPGPVAGLVVVAVLLAGLTGWLGWRTYDHAQTQKQGEAAVRAANEYVAALWTVNPTTSQQVYSDLLKNSTGPMKAQWAQSSSGFANVIRESGAVTTGSIATSGLTSIKGDTAVVLVGPNVIVANSKTENAKSGTVQAEAPRQYRMRVTTKRINGTWLISNMEFVA